MDAVISLLDEEHSGIVKNLWSELDERFGVRGMAVTPFVHFSYQIAMDYSMERMDRALRHVASSTPHFSVRTGGLGIFTGTSPVLHIPVVRSPELGQLHQHLWEELSGSGCEVPDIYAPSHWMPHITLSHGDLDGGNLPEIVKLLAGRNFTWMIPIDNLALIYRVGEVQGLHSRYPLPPRS